MNNIDTIYESKEILMRKTPLKIVSWITILIVLLISFIIISFIPYNKYLNYYGYISKEDKYYLNVYVEQKYIENIQDYKLIIDHKKRKFKIINIDNQLYYEKNKPYYLVTIYADLEENLLIQNNVINVIFNVRKTTLQKEIFKVIKEVIYERND